MAERDGYYAVVNGEDYAFTGSKKTYDALGTTLGIRKLSSRSSTGSPRRGEEVTKTLPKIRIVLKKTATKKARRVDVRVDPDKVEDALKKLPTKSVNGQKILQAYLPRKRCYV